MTTFEQLPESIPIEHFKASMNDGTDTRMLLRSVLSGKDDAGSCLKTWFRHFDLNQNGRIDFKEFKAGMVKFAFPGQVEVIWRCLDQDNSGEIGFDEIDSEEAAQWNMFRRWCGSKFANARDMISQLKRSYSQAHGQTASTKDSPNDTLNRKEFTEGAQNLGWDHGFEVILFNALDIDGEGLLVHRYLQWVDLEAKQYKQKEAAKRHHKQVTMLKRKKKQVGQSALKDFKAFLKKRFGPLFRAWRRVLDTDGTMTVGRAELYKAVRHLEWKGNTASLWKALDHDESGITTIEELDPQAAQHLAFFREWAVSRWGAKPSANMFRDLDKHHRRKLSYPQFVSSCQKLGFDRKLLKVASSLDWQDNKYLQEEDFRPFDVWRPPEWLTAAPNYQAAQEFKKHLLRKYGHFLKAWCAIMDKDSSNSCSWHEFQHVVKYVKFNNDVAGAWLALDEDLSGFITLKEIDVEAHNCLVYFKTWCDSEFGSVRSAFKILDKDGGGALSFKEFRGACRQFGFDGNLRQLFNSLDQQGEGSLGLKEVSFLDDWDLDSDIQDLDEMAEADGMPLEQDKHQENQTLEYYTAVPGPGAYDLPSSFAAKDHVPATRHLGAFSFPFSRRRGMTLDRLVKSVGPANYNPSLKHTTQRKPAWTFGGGNILPKPQSTTPRDKGHTSPGPGSYDLKPTFNNGPHFSMRPRRGIRLHPAQKACAASDKYAA
mmetsp:Transcript_58179/g.127564  ORF Transcript_58179/g.127564 Transcript_58179/m.127564 type:complete len:709 (+) Transcript_58179:88-2214(+)